MVTIDSTSGFADAKSARVTKPKIYDEQLAFLTEAGTKDRIEAVRGDTKKADFLRAAIDDAIFKAARELKRREK